jgi:hypothetical protein
MACDAGDEHGEELLAVNEALSMLLTGFRLQMSPRVPWYPISAHGLRVSVRRLCRKITSWKISIEGALVWSAS